MINRSMIQYMRQRLLAIRQISHVPLRRRTNLKPLNKRPISLKRHKSPNRMINRLLLRPKSLSGFHNRVKISNRRRRHYPMRDIKSNHMGHCQLVTALSLRLRLHTRKAASPITLRHRRFIQPNSLRQSRIVRRPFNMINSTRMPLNRFLLSRSNITTFTLTISSLLINRRHLIIQTPISQANLTVNRTTLRRFRRRPLIPIMMLQVTNIRDPIPIRQTHVTTRQLPLLNSIIMNPNLQIHPPTSNNILHERSRHVPPSQIRSIRTLLRPMAHSSIPSHVNLNIARIGISTKVKRRIRRMLTQTQIIKLT